MSYCPKCLAEYREGIDKCIDCNIALAEGVPIFCENCKEQVSETDVFCDSCGVIQPRVTSDDLPECDTHPDHNAIGGCVLCGKPVCVDCAKHRDGRIYCEDDDHYNVHLGYVVAVTTSTDYQAEMFRANLEGAGIRALIFNQHDHVYFVNMGSLAVVNVMVPHSQIDDARQIIEALLEDPPDDEEKPEGGEQTEAAEENVDGDKE